MEETESQRLREFLKYKKINEVDLARELRLRKQQVSLWFNNVNGIPAKHYAGILNYLVDMDARWFITGEGKMVAENKNPEGNYSDNFKKVTFHH